MRLHQELRLEQARLKDLRVVLSNADPKITVGIRTALTEEVAFAFGCHDLVYAGTVPRSGVDKILLEGEEANCEICLQNDNFSFHATADSVGHYIAKLEGEGPALLFQIKVLGYAGILTDLVERVKLDPLLVILKPAQQALDLQEAQKTADAGTPIISEPICESCEAGVKLLDGTLMHADGKVCIARQTATAAADQEKLKEFDEPVRPADAPLASATEMGGTHQADTKKRRGRPHKAAEPEIPEPDFMETLQ